MNYSSPPWRLKPSFIEIVCLIAGSMLVFWYSWIVDDAYVYFRYVDNWIIHGQGLVWNPSEYVEGFSSPIWALLLGGLRLVHLDYWIIVRGVGMLCFALFWYLACLVNRGFMPFNRDPSLPLLSCNIPLIYLSFTYAVACYFSSGLESPLVIVAAVTYVAGILWPQSRLLQGLIGLTPLVRHECILPLFLFLAWSFFAKRVRPVTAFIVFVISVGAYGLFRVWYYADFLPNTFYLKDTTSIVQGLKFVYDTIMPYFTVPYIMAMSFIYWILSKHGLTSLLRDNRLVIIALAVSVAAYVVKIGGDPRHFRYLAFPYVLVVLATGGLFEHLTVALPHMTRRYVNMFLVLFGLSTSLCYPRQLQQHPFFRSHFGYSHTSFLNINDAATHRVSSTGITPPWCFAGSYLAYGSAKDRFRIGSRSDTIVDCGTVGRHDFRTETSDLITVPLIADWWCQTAYLHPASPVIHSLGLTDPFLARTQMQSNRPAHKYGLIPMSEDLLRIRCKYGFVCGAFDEAISNGEAPDWVRDNINSIRQIEKKAYNDHILLQNIANALSLPMRINP